MTIRPIAINELNDWWDSIIKQNSGNDTWVSWKKSFVEENISGKRKTFFAFDNSNQYIGQCTLLFEGRNKNMTGGGKAEIIKLEVIENMRGKGISSMLYNEAKRYAKEKGVHTLTIGVEPKEVRNMQIYFHWGFTNFVECVTETYPPPNKNEKGETVTVIGYSQQI